MTKVIGIMQPYFFPYIGYFQLINSVDTFVIYDNIKYTKKGWINRNRILSNGKDKLITLPIKKDSDYLNVVERMISDDWQTEKIKFLNQLSSSYKKAPKFTEIFPIINDIINNDEKNLFDFIYNSLTQINYYLGIKTQIIKSSEIDIDHNLKSKDKVIAICKKLEASDYINPIGGTELYDKGEFIKHGINLNFIKSNSITYKQFENEFVPWLSIIDLLMFNSKDKIVEYLSDYSLI
jgi:hypothetical protein